MKKMILVILLAMIASGCTTNGVYDAKKTWLVVGGVVVTGYVISNQDSESKEKCNQWVDEDGNFWCR